MPFAENLGTGGGSLDAQYGSSPTANTNAPLLLDPRTSGNFVYTPGTAGNYVAVPHSPSLNILGTEGTPFLSIPFSGVATQYATSPNVAALQITGDIDIAVRVALEDWDIGGFQTFIAKTDVGTSGRSYELLMIGSLLRMQWWDGAALQTRNSTAGVSFADGQAAWIRCVVDVNNGAGGNDVLFYTAPDSSSVPVSWTQLGTTVTTAGTSTLTASTTALYVGSLAGVLVGGGKYYRAIVRNGINGTAVFDADFTQQALGSRGFIESTGKLVSLVGNAAQIVDGTTYGTMPTTSVAAGWTVPDSAALDVSDLEMTARLSLNDWTAATNQTIVSKYDNTGPQRSYIWYIATNGRPVMDYDIGGVLQPSVDAGAAYPFTDGQTYWVRVRRIAATGVWRFYWAPDSETEPTVWTNVGGDRAGTAGVLNNSTASTTIGAFSNAASGYISQGRMYRAIIRNANTGGTKVLDADFTRQLQFASTFTEGSSQLATVTTVGAARIERDRDLEIVVRASMDEVTGGGFRTLVAKRRAAPGISYNLFRNITGQPGVSIGRTGNGGAEVTTFQSTIALPFANGETFWLKATVDVNNGANGATATFYRATDSATEPTVWTLHEAVTVTGALSSAVTTSDVELMSQAAGTNSMLAGKVHHAIIRNGINGPAVLDIDFTDAITTGAETYLPDTPSEVIPEAEQYLPNLGWGGTALNARFGSAVGADTNDPLLLTHTGTNYLYLPGGAVNNLATIPDSPALDVVGDVDFRFDVALDTYRPPVVRDLFLRSGSDPNRYVYSEITEAGLLRFYWYPLGTNASIKFAISTAPVPYLGGERTWIRIVLDVDNGAGGHDVIFYISQDGINWSQLGNVVTGAGTTNLPSVTADMRVWSNTSSGKIYRCQMLNGINGPLVYDVNFTTGITSGAQTTFTESSTNAATVTINRSTSGRKSVAVVQDVLLFGTDDYLEVPDNDLLDFGATDSFTVMTAARAWNVGGGGEVLVSKTASPGGANAGYSLYRVTGAGNQVVGAIGDGAVSSFQVANDSALGTLTTRVLIRDTGADTIGVSIGGAAPVSGVDATTATLSNTTALQVGRGGGGLWANMEWRGSAVWRRALTSTELALVNTHYTTGPTAASTALMQQAAFWIDAGTRSVAQINRSTSGRKSVACARCTWLLGTDDFFEVPASNLFDFAQGQDYTLLVLHRGWWAQGTNDTLLATSSSTTASAAGWAMSNSSGDPWEAGGRHGDGSNGVTAVAPRRDVGALTGTFLVRDCDNDTLTAFTGSTSGTPVTDTTTGTIGNTNVMRLGRLSTTGAEYLDAEVVAAVVWRRKLTTAERNAVLAYYGV